MVLGCEDEERSATGPEASSRLSLIQKQIYEQEKERVVGGVRVSLRTRVLPAQKQIEGGNG